MPEIKVYISGPISGLSEAVFKKNFADAANLLDGQGFIPVNPTEITADCGEICESAGTFEDGSFKHSWKCYMKYDIIKLLDCDAIYMIEGWEQSRGAQLELAIATGLELPILKFDVHDEEFFQ